MDKNKKKLGSLPGLLITIGIGLAFYFILPLVPSIFEESYAYSNIVKGINSNFLKQIYWFFINFTEPDFTAGAMSGLFLIIGAVIAWQLAIRGSKYQGFSICYGSSHTWPWNLAAQVISLLLTMYLFKYLLIFELDSVSWIPTFIVVVSAPSGIMLTYGPSIPTLFTASILPAIVAAPCAYWFSLALSPILMIPTGVSNLFSMIFSGFIIMSVVRVLPWMKEVSANPQPKKPLTENNYSASWSVRRMFAEFTEPHFYGNEIAGIFLIIGALADWIINKEHGLSGLAGEYLPAILLSQFIAGGIGIYLYAHKFDNGGWFATYVPVVSAAPFCVLAFGTNLPLVIFIGIISGIYSAPIASALYEILPKKVHIFVANVTAMAFSTTLVWATVNMLPWFR